MPNSFQNVGLDGGLDDFMQKHGEALGLGLTGLAPGLKIGDLIFNTRNEVNTLQINAQLQRRTNAVAQIQNIQYIRDVRRKTRFLRGTILDSAGRSGIRTTSGSVTARLAELASELKLTELRAQFNLENETLLRTFKAEFAESQASALESQLPFKIAGKAVGGAASFFDILK